MTGMLLISEQFVGDPITLQDVEDDLVSIIEMSWPLDRFGPLAASVIARSTVMAALRAGDGEAFAQSRLSRRWAKFARRYWDDIQELPEKASGLSGDDAEFNGQPIVTWKTSFLAARDLMATMGVTMKAKLAADSAKRRHPVVHSTTQQLEVGRFLAVSEHRNGPLDENKSRLLRDYQRWSQRKGPALGREAFERWLGRYQDGKFRITLRSSDNSPLRGEWLEDAELSG